MRLLIYNIAYGTGSEGGIQSVFSSFRYLRTSYVFLEKILRFIDRSHADVVGLVEIDTGSFRTGFSDQTRIVAKHLKNYRYCAIKYPPSSAARGIPILRMQANAFFSAKKAVQARTYYMPFGMKALILELHLNGIRFFLVHLALKKAVRKKQIDYIAKIASINPGPVIIGGDFNAFSGSGEIETLKKKLDLYDPDEKNIPTFPANAPKIKLDFILCSREIKKAAFSVPDVTFSDHLPLIFDFDY